MNSHHNSFFILLSLAAIALLVTGVAAAKKYRTNMPYIGVYTQNIDEDLKEAFDLNRDNGVVIVDVVDDSPAEKAGLEKKDIIVSFDGHKIDDPEVLLDLVGDTKVGDKVDVVYIRDGEEHTATINVGDRGETRSFWLDSDARSGYHRYNLSIAKRSYIGVGVQNLNDQLGDYFGVKDGAGVLVTEVYDDSPAKAAGMKAGDVITGIDKEEIVDSRDLQDIIGDHDKGDKVTVDFLRKGTKMTASVEVDEDTHGISAYSLPDYTFNVPNPRTFNRSMTFDKSDFFNMDEYRKAMDEYREQLDQNRSQMDEMREQLKQLQKDLQELHKKLE